MDCNFLEMAGKNISYDFPRSFVDDIILCAIQRWNRKRMDIVNWKTRQILKGIDGLFESLVVLLAISEGL